MSFTPPESFVFVGITFLFVFYLRSFKQTIKFLDYPHIYLNIDISWKLYSLAFKYGFRILL